MLQKLLDLLKFESFRPHQETAIQSIIQDQKDAVICLPTNVIGLFHATYSVLPSVESYRNYRKPTQRGVQGYLSSLQRRVPIRLFFIFTFMTRISTCIQSEETLLWCPKQVLFFISHLFNKC